MGEVLFIQVGNNANYIASHMWNSRHEGTMDEQAAKLYHSGTKKTYPRSIFVESPNNLGSLSSLETENEPRSSIWDGSIQKTSSEASHPNHEIPDPARYVWFVPSLVRRYYPLTLTNIYLLLGMVRSTGQIFFRYPFSSQLYAALFILSCLPQPQPELHHKSICELPKWTNGEYFDAFHKGVLQSSSNDTLSSDFMEDLMDQCRYFAEACDHLGTIEITTEHTGGAAGLTTSLLQALREEFGNAVCMPVWCANARKIDERVLKYEGATLLDNIATMHNRISVLDSALFFNRALEYASSIVPISLTRILQGIYGSGAVPSTEGDRQYNTYISTATAAAALNAACIYQCAPTVTPAVGSMSALHYHDGSAEQSVQGFDPRVQSSRNTLSFDTGEAQVNNAHQWCALATMRGRLPMCFLEASFPGILTNPEVKTVGEYPGLDQHLLDAFNPQKRSIRANKDGAVVRLGTVNPFATALSPLPMRQGGAEGVSDFPFARAFTNLLSVRGSSSPGMLCRCLCVLSICECSGE